MNRQQFRHALETLRTEASIKWASSPVQSEEEAAWLSIRNKMTNVIIAFDHEFPKEKDNG